ncbi:MAG TPA: glycosyltransferase family 1 protein [Anaerolineae bacterium]|nr:glycosyltransferase family 1 protein [Anaerolineae bacterium]
MSSIDLICLSHLRWDFVHQRPQHLMMRCAQERRVFFVEEPIYGVSAPELEVVARGENLWVMKPHLPTGLNPADVELTQEELLEHLLEQFKIRHYLFWYYTPMALGFTQHFKPKIVVYDCMDELSAFRGAPPQLVACERELFQRAQLVFAGGHSLYEAKCKQHSRVYEFPSSVDRAHFGQARHSTTSPADQDALARPRLGFFGVIDERMDIELIAGLADVRPDWQIIFVGPVIKIDPKTLPQRPNIHYLGSKPYAELPKYLGGWDVALLPFARNEATRFISPTKTPEYLAGGKPVISTSIRDVVYPYGQRGLVQIADTVPEFVAAVEYALQIHTHDPTWCVRVDESLAQLSWDNTWQAMSLLIEIELARSWTPRHAAQAMPVLAVANE